MTAPGWYPDPSGDGTQRYWDGNAWGPSAPPPAAPPTTPPLTPGQSAGVQVPVLPPLPPKKSGRLKPLLIIGGVLFLAWLLLPGLGGNKNESSSSAKSSSSSPTAPGSVGNSASKEDAYIALLEKWANRDGYAVGDRATLIAAGNEACSRMSGGEDLITASASVMDSYGLPGKQAQSVGVAAAEVLCPQNDPMSRPQPSSTVKPTTTAITGLQSPLMGITMPAGSDGTSIVNDANKDGEPDRMETWEVSMSYDATLDAMKEILQPYGGSLDGIPWEEGDSEGTAAAQDRLADWWWGRDGEPLILVAIQQFGDNTTTTVYFDRRD